MRKLGWVVGCLWVLPLLGCPDPEPCEPETEVCNGADDDCDGVVDEGYVADTSCFKQGVCANGNAASSCIAGVETACATGAATAASDATCNGIDEDCSGAADEDYAPDTSCFLPGACAAGNEASSCDNGVATPCATGAPLASTDTTCDGVDDDCDDDPDDDYVQNTACFRAGVCALENAASSCDSGQETACATGSPTAADDANCNDVDEDCDGTEDEDYVADTSCFKPGVCAPGNAASSCTNGVETLCAATGTPTASSDVTCDNVDQDCDGTADEDYVRNDSCFRVGVCAAGNVASSCQAGGMESACQTGSPASADLCYGRDDDCDGSTIMGCAALTRSTVSGSALPGSDLGGSKTVVIQSRDDLGVALTRGGSDFSAAVQAPGTAAAPLALTDNQDGTYSSSFTPATSGSYYISVSSNGSSIDGSPFRAVVWQLINNAVTCGGCWKDLYSGEYTGCDGTTPDATKNDCTSTSVPGCTFTPERNVTEEQCKRLCEQEPGCYFVTSYYGYVCNLHLMTTCPLETTGNTDGRLSRGP